MAASTIGLTIGFAVLAAITYYVGFVLPGHQWRRWSQASWFVLAFVVIPMMVACLYLQDTAPGRLRAMGITPHPALGASVGLGVGTGRVPTFVFQTTASRDTVLAYYQAEDTRDGWVIDRTDASLLSLHREAERLTIATGETLDGRHVIYMFDKVDRPASRLRPRTP